MSKPESIARTKRTTTLTRATTEERPQRSTAALPDDRRRTMIAESAYFRAQARGFREGDAVADWLASEQEVDQLLANGRA
jgi:hypothetical protein